MSTPGEKAIAETKRLLGEMVKEKAAKRKAEQAEMIAKAPARREAAILAQSEQLMPFLTSQPGRFTLGATFEPEVVAELQPMVDALNEGESGKRYVLGYCT